VIVRSATEAVGEVSDGVMRSELHEDKASSNPRQPMTEAWNRMVVLSLGERLGSGDGVRKAPAQFARQLQLMSDVAVPLE
jgi:hypothetical protein